MSGTLGPVARLRRVATAAFLVAPCVGCAAEGPSGYLGTGSLSRSGATEEPVLLSQVAELTDCPRAEEHDRVFTEFSILAIGPGCVMDGIARGDSFRTDPGTVCSLNFPDGTHAIKVTLVSFHYGVESSLPERTYLDPEQLELVFGGDDAAGVYSLYRFTGSSVATIPPTTNCSIERSKRAGRVPGAFEANPPEPPHPQIQ